MSIRPEVSWSVHCDWPGCEYQFEYDVFSVFGDGWDASEIVTEANGYLDEDNKRHYCENHRAVWESDLDDVAATPKPYLLILDENVYSERKVRLVT